MSSSSVHHQSTLPNKSALLSKTPAMNRTGKRTQLHTISKTVGSKAKHFEIYIDPHRSTSPSSNDLDLVPAGFLKPSISATPNKNKSKNAVPSTRKKALKPLEDKTNTIRKKNNFSDVSVPLDLSEQETSDYSPSLKGMMNGKVVQPSLDLTGPTPHNPTHKKTLKFKDQVSPPNTKLKLLYRTPTTAKRAARPPQPLFGSDCDDDGGLDASPVKSLADTFQIDFSLEHIPDVEYGPPSASFESIECPLEEDAVDFSEFFGGLHASRNHMISSLGENSHGSAADFEQQMHRILEEDGQKDRWVSEPICPMTSYQGGDLLDDMHLPPTCTAPSATRTTTSRKPLTTTTRNLRSTQASVRPRDAASMHPRSRLAQAAGPASTKQPISMPGKLAASASAGPVDGQAPRCSMAGRYQALVAGMVRQDQLLVDHDLNQFLASDSSNLDSVLTCSAWDPDLDQFQLQL